jgi:mono/diheme cytochrome c family protein
MELASSMWNHAPIMWDAMPIVGTRVPRLTSPEAADLMAFFYSLLHFSTPGDERRGRLVYEQKNCAGCHNDEPGIGPALSDWTRAQNPLEWPERMWNHASLMNPEISRRRLGWPGLTGQEVTDLITYIQSLRGAGAASAVPIASDPERGQIAFDRQCRECHSLGAEDSKIDLLARPAPTAFVDYIARMWNHVPSMAARSGGRLPQLERGQMADIGSYLFAKHYFDEPGNVADGQMVYGENCAACHGGRRQEFNAPDLALSVERFSPVTMTAALWRHDKAIQEMAGRARIPAPQFDDGDMADLIAYLNSRLVIRVASQ